MYKYTLLNNNLPKQAQLKPLPETIRQPKINGK